MTADRIAPSNVTALVPRGAARGPAPHARVMPETQGALAFDLRGGHPAMPEVPELTSVAPMEPEVRAWAARLAQALVESLHGRRPVSQLVRWMAPDVYRDVERRAALVRMVSGPGGRRPAGAQVPPQVRSVHVCRPSPSYAEVSVHVRHGARSRAVALRLERRDDRWLCTVAEFG